MTDREKKKIYFTQKDEKKKRVFLIVFFLFTIFCAIFSVLCLLNMENGFIKKNEIIVSIVACIIIIGVFAISVYFIYKNRESLVKILLSVFIFLTFCLLLIFILQKTGFFKVIKDADTLQIYLEKAGVWMPIFYILLQYLQVVILPIPSLISTVAGVALFGAFKALLYSFIGILLGSITAFFIGRKWGKKAVGWMIGDETLKKWQKKVKGKDNLVLSIMFLLPLFPDDVLCFLAGLSSMSLKFFIIFISLSRLLAIGGTCYSIDFIPFNTWWGITLWITFAVIMTVSFIVVFKKLDDIQAWIKQKKQKK